MPKTPVTQHIFTNGQIDQINWKRVDAEGYLHGAQDLTNCIVGTTGLAQKRNGTLTMADLTTLINVDPNTRGYELKDNQGNYYAVISNVGTFSVFKLTTPAIGIAPTVTLINNVVTPYLSQDLPLLDYSSNADSIVYSQGKYPPGRVTVATYTPAITFGYEPLNIFPPPSDDFGNINYNGAIVTGSVTGNILTITFTGSGIVGFDNTSWNNGQIIGSGATDLQPIGSGIIQSTAFDPTMNTITFTVGIQTPFNPNLPTSGSQYSIRQPAFSATVGYPNKTTFYQNRLWFANTAMLPNNVFASQIGKFVSFDVGTGLDTDAIVYNIGNNATGGINWLNGGKQFEIYAQNYELVCPQDQNAPLAPGTFAVRQQSSYGSSNSFKPSSYINDSYYVSRTGKSIISFHFTGVGLAYAAENIALQSQDLVNNPIRSALIRGDSSSQDNFLYFCNGTQFITVFQFASEEKLAALTPLDFGSGILILDVFAVNNRLLLLKKFVATGHIILEIMDNTSVCPLVTKMDSTKQVNIAANGLVTGIDYLDGIIAHLVVPTGDLGESMQLQNGVLVEAPVANGQCYFNNPNGYVGIATIGILFEATITPPYVFAGAEKFNYSKRIAEIYVDYYQTLDLVIDGQAIPYQNFDYVQNTTPAQLALTARTGTASVYPMDGYNRYSTFSITQRSPFDMIITGITYMIDASTV